MICEEGPVSTMKYRANGTLRADHAILRERHSILTQLLLLQKNLLIAYETLFADVPNISIENATKMSKDRKLWSSNRPSLRCQPL